MLDRIQLLKMLVGLKKINDLDLIENDALLSTICADSALVRSIARTIESIYEDFDYGRSPEFLERLEGKSAQVQAMHRQLLNAEKQRDAVGRLGHALVSILDSEDAYRLVAIEHHDSLDTLRDFVRSITG